MGNKDKCSGFPKESGEKAGKIDVTPSAPTKVSGTPASQPITSGKDGKKRSMGSGTIAGKL